MDKLTGYTRDSLKNTNLQLYKVLEALFPNDAVQTIQNQTLVQHKSKARQTFGTAINHADTRTTHTAATITTRMDAMDKFFQHIVGAKDRRELVDKLRASAWQQKKGEILQAHVKKGIADVVACFKEFHRVKGQPGVYAAVLNATYEATFKKHYSDPRNFFALFFSVPTRTSRGEPWLGVQEEGGKFKLKVETKEISNDVKMDGVNALQVILGRAEALVESTRRRPRHNTAQQRAKLKHTLAQNQQHKFITDSAASVQDAALEQTEWFYEEWCADATSTPQVTPSRVTLQHAPKTCPVGGQTCQVKLGIEDVCWKEVHDVGEGNWRTSTEIHVQCSAQPPGPLLKVAQLRAWVVATPNLELQKLLDEKLLYTDARLCVDVQSGGIDMARIFYEAVRPERHVYGGEMPRAEPRGGRGTLVLASPKQCWVCHEVLHITEPACQVCGAHVCPRCETLTSVDKPPQLCVVQPAPEGTAAEVVAQEHRRLVEETRQFLRQHTAMQAARQTAAKEYPLLEFSPSDEVVASVPLYRLQFTLGTGQHKKTVESLDAISLQLKCVDVPYTDALGVLDAGPYRNLIATLDGSPWSRVYHVDHADWHATPLPAILLQQHKNGVYLRSQRFKDRAYHIQGVVVRGRPARLHGSGCGRVVAASAHAPVQELVYASEDSQFHVRFVDSSSDHARNADSTLATKELESKQQRVKANDKLVPLPGADFDGQAGCLWARASMIKGINEKECKKIDENQDFRPALSQDKNFLQVSMEQRLALAGGEEVKATGVLLTHNRVQYAPVSVLAHGTIAHRAPDASGAMLAFVNITSHAHALPWEPATNTLLYEPGDVCVFRASASSEASDELTGVVTKMALKMDTAPTLQWAALDDEDDDDDNNHQDKMAAEWEVKPLLQRFVRSLDGAGDIACVNLHGSQLVQRADPGIVAFRPPSPVALARPLVVVEADRRWLLWQPKHMCAHCAAVATHHSCESPYLHPRTGFEMLQHYGNAMSTLVQEPPFASALRDNLTRTERGLLAANNVVREPADDFDTRLQSIQSEYRKMCVLHTDLRVKSVYADAAEPDAGARFFYGDTGMRDIAFVPLLRAIQDGDSPFFDEGAKARAWLKLCADWEEFVKWKRVYETAVLKLQDEQRNFEAWRDLSPETALKQVIAAVSQFHAGVSSVDEERAVEMLESQVIQFFPSTKNTTSPFADERKNGVEAVGGGMEGTEGDEDREAGAGLAAGDENTPNSTQAEQGADNGDKHAALYLVDSAVKRKREGDASSVQTKKQKNPSHQAVHFLNRALKKIIQESERPSVAQKWDSDIKSQVACLLHGQFEDASDVQFSPAMNEMFAYSLKKAKESAKDATNSWDVATKEAEGALEHIKELQQYECSEQWDAIQANLGDERVQGLFQEFKMLKELGLRDLENFISPHTVDRLELNNTLPSDPDKAQSALLKAYLLGAKCNRVQEKIMDYVRQECNLTPEKFSTDFFDETMDDIEKKLTMFNANAPEDANAGGADAEYTPIEVVDTSDSSSNSGDDDDHAADDADFQREFLVKQSFPEQYLSLMGLWREYDPAVDESEENAAGDGDAAMDDAGTPTPLRDGNTAMADAGDGDAAMADAGDGDTATTGTGNGDAAMAGAGTPTPAMDRGAVGDHVEDMAETLGSTVLPEDGVDEILRSSLFVDGTDVMPRAQAILHRSTEDALAEMKKVLQHQVRHGGTLRVPWDFDWFANEKDEGYRGEDEDEDTERQGESEAPRLVESAMPPKRLHEHTDSDHEQRKKMKGQGTHGAGSDSERGGTDSDSDDSSSSIGSEEEDSEERKRGGEEHTDSPPPAPVEKVTVTQALPRQTFRAFCGRDLKGPGSSSIHFEQNAIAALMKVHGHEMHVDLDFDEHLVLTAHKTPDGSVEYAWLPASEKEQQEIQDQQRVCLSELVSTCTLDFRDKILSQTLSQEQWHEQVAALQTNVMRSTHTAHLRKCQRLRLPASSKGWVQAYSAPEMRCAKMWTWKVDSGEGILFEVSDDETVEVNADKLPVEMPELTAEGIAANNAAVTAQGEALATGINSDTTAGVAGNDATAESPVGTGGPPTGGNGGEKSTETAPAAGDVATAEPPAEGIAANNDAVTAQEEALTTDINSDTMAEAAGDNATAKQQPPASGKIPAKKPTELEKIQLELDTALNELNATTSKLHADAAKILDWDGLIRYTKTLDELAITPGACVYVWWLREARHKTRSQPQDFLDTTASRSRFDMWRIAHVQDIDSSQRIVTCWIEGDPNPTILTREGENTFRTEKKARVQLVECPMHTNTLNVVRDEQERDVRQVGYTEKKERKKNAERVQLQNGPLTGIVCESQLAEGEKAFNMACADLQHVLARGDQCGLLFDAERADFENRGKVVACEALNPDDVSKMLDTFTVDFSPDIVYMDDDDVMSIAQNLKTRHDEFFSFYGRNDADFLESFLKGGETMTILQSKRESISANLKAIRQNSDMTRPEKRAKSVALLHEQSSTVHYITAIEKAEKLGEFAKFAKKWGQDGIKLKLEFNAFVQKLLSRMQKTHDQKTSPTDVVQIHWQSSIHVDGIPAFLFREHVPGKDLADHTKYRPVACPAPPQLRLGDCIETGGAAAPFVTPRKVDLSRLLCVAAEPGPITMEDAWRQGRLHAGEQIRFPLVYATRQRQARMLPWLADETDILLVDRLPGLVQKLLTVVADVFSATAPGQGKSLLEAAENAAQGVVTGARNAATVEDFVQYCMLIGIVRRTLKLTSSKGIRDVKDINQRREKDNTESWTPHRERILSQFEEKTRGTAQLQQQFAVETKVTYATDHADVTEEIEFDPVLGIVSALKPSLLVDFWEQYQLSDGYVEPDDDDEDGNDAQGAAYSVEDPSGEDADEAALQLHPLKKLRQQYARGVTVGTKLESESAMANQASPDVLPPKVETAVKSLQKHARGKLTAHSEAGNVCEQLVGLLQDKSNSDPATCFYDGRLEFSRAFFGAMRCVGQRLTTEDDGSDKTKVTWASTHVLAGLTHFAQNTCASRLLRGEKVGENDRLFQCLVSLCADATRVLIGLEHQAASERRRVWQLWQTYLHMLSGAFLRTEDAGASAQALYHVFDGNYIEGFDMHHNQGLVQDMFAQMDPVTVLGWKKRDGIDDPHVKAMLTVFGKIENASQLDYPDWETLGNAERSRFFFQDTPAGAVPTMRLGWCAFMEAQNGAYAAKRQFNQDKKLVQVRAEQQFFARDGRKGPDPQIRLFEMNAHADRMDVHPLLLVLANHVFRRQAMGMSTAVTDTYYITHEDFGREPGAREKILACQEVMMEEIRSADLCFADSRRGIVQWVRSGDPVSFQGQDGRVCRAELRPLDDAGVAGVDIVKLAQDRTEQTMSLTFAEAGPLTCLSVGVVESLEVVAVGDYDGKVHVKATQHSQASPAAFALPNATVIQGVNFSRDGSELAVLWFGQDQQWLTVLAVRGSRVDATAQGADVFEITLSLKTTRPWTDSAQELSEHGVGSNLSVCTPTYFQFDRFTEIDSELWTPVLPPLPQFWSNKFSAAKQRLSSLRQRESVMGWQEALVRVIQKLVPVYATDSSCATVAATIHDKTGYDVCLLHSATEILQDQHIPAKRALHFHKSVWIGGRDEDVRGRTVLAGVVEQKTHEHVFCVSSAQDDSVPDGDMSGDGGDGNKSDDDGAHAQDPVAVGGASAFTGDQATTETAVEGGQVFAEDEMLDATPEGTAVEGGQVFAEDEMLDATPGATSVETGQITVDEAMPGTTPENSDLRPRRIAQVLASAGQRHFPETPPAHSPEAYYVPVPPASLYVPVHAAPPENSREDSTAVFHYYVPFQP